MHKSVAAILLFALASTASAEDLRRVTSKSAFQRIVDGRVLFNQDHVGQIAADGTGSGHYRGQPATLLWQWKNGMFCRHGTIGKRKLKHECQKVFASARTLRLVRHNGRGPNIDYVIGSKD